MLREIQQCTNLRSFFPVKYVQKRNSLRHKAHTPHTPKPHQNHQNQSQVSEFDNNESFE